jgi:hypothetical protein
MVTLFTIVGPTSLIISISCSPANFLLKISVLSRVMSDFHDQSQCQLLLNNCDQTLNIACLSDYNREEVIMWSSNGTNFGSVISYLP